MKSHNIVFPEAQRAALVKEDVPAVGPDTILIKTALSHISTGTETTCYRGVFDEGTNWREWVQYPFHPGYSLVGHVLEVGENVSDFAPGDRVLTGCTHGEYATVEYDEAAKNGMSLVICKIPEGVSNEVAVWRTLACVGIAGVRRAEIEMGENVVVIGAGPIGQMVAQFARVAGALHVIVVDPVKKRLDCALQGGATHVLAMGAAESIGEVEKILGGERPEVVFDTTGHYAVLPIACAMARKYGRIILSGDCSQPSKQALGPVVFKSLEIRGAHFGKGGDIESLPWPDKRNSCIFFDLAQQGRIKVDHLISHRYKPEEAQAVYEQLLHDRSYTMGVVFDWA